MQGRTGILLKKQALPACRLLAKQRSPPDRIKQSELIVIFPALCPLLEDRRRRKFSARSNNGTPHGEALKTRWDARNDRFDEQANEEEFSEGSSR